MSSDTARRFTRRQFRVYEAVMGGESPNQAEADLHGQGGRPGLDDSLTWREWFVEQYRVATSPFDAAHDRF